MKITEKEAHIKEFHDLINCECGQSVEKYQMEKHKLTDCGLRLVTCEFCQMPFQARSVQAHNKYCGSRTEKCDKCNKFVMLMDLKDHPCNRPANSPPIQERKTTLRQSTLVCPTCLDQFDLFDELMVHIATIHGFTP